MSAQNVAVNVKVGEHIEWHIFGVTLHGDTIISTLVAGAIIIVLGLWVRRKVNARKPSNGQLFFETVTGQVEQQVEDTMGIKTAPFVVPLAMALFLFILIANWLSILPVIHGGGGRSAAAAGLRRQPDVRAGAAGDRADARDRHPQAGPARLLPPPGHAEHRHVADQHHRRAGPRRSRWPFDSSATSSPGRSWCR